MGMPKLDVEVRMSPVDKSKIVRVVLTRDDCESVWALCHSAGKPLGDRNEHLKAYFAEVMRIVPKGSTGGILCPIPAEVVASVLGICYITDFMGKKSGRRLAWVDSVTRQLEKALCDAQIRVRIQVGGNITFDSTSVTNAEGGLKSTEREDDISRGEYRRVEGSSPQPSKPWWKVW